jgi:hypothetical protein
MGHTTKGPKMGEPMELRHMRGSGSLTDLADSITALGPLPKVEGDMNKRAYIKPLNARNEMEYDENNVIVTRLTLNGGMRHECIKVCNEYEALNGDVNAPYEQITAVGLIRKYGSSRKASEITGIAHTTLNARKNSLEKNWPDDYNRIMNMSVYDLDIFDNN